MTDETQLELALAENARLRGENEQLKEQNMLQQKRIQTLRALLHVPKDAEPAEESQPEIVESVKVTEVPFEPEGD